MFFIVSLIGKVADCAQWLGKVFYGLSFVIYELNMEVLKAWMERGRKRFESKIRRMRKRELDALDIDTNEKND